jgi:ADP-ribose pyrophosphatase YjhB (NUDIX family)
MSAPLAPAPPDPRPPSTRARLLHRVITFTALFHRPMTLGVRGLVIDADNRIMLVRHTYVPGFYLPGGGVEAGETMAGSLARELVEECGVHVVGEPELRAVYLNRRNSPRDHVALYIVRDFHYDGPRPPDREIAESGFFPLDRLPEGTTPATRARIAEVFDAAPLSPCW